MEDDELRGLHGIALELADVADRISTAHFGGQVAADRKHDGSFVTAADHAVEAALRERLATATPDLPILGEEEGGAVDPRSPTWVIDPIDATNNFMRGIPVYATLIAVVSGGQAVVGVASAPALGERWDAWRGGGTRRNGVAVTVSEAATLAESQVLHGGLDWWRGDAATWERLGRFADAAWRTRGFGDFWMHLLVAGGMAEVAVEQDLAPWDVAALWCIVNEAGGRLTSFDGVSSPLDTGEALSSNGRVHDEALALLRA